MTTGAVKKCKWAAEHFEEVLAAALIAAMACLAMLNVVTRYLIQLPLAFTEELEVNAMVWLTLLGAASAFRKRKHLRLLFFTQKFSHLVQKIIERIVSLMAAGLFGCLGYLGWMQLLDEKFLENISEHYRIIGFRNILIHGYDIIDEMIVWKAIENHLPILTEEIKELLNM